MYQNISSDREGIAFWSKVVVSKRGLIVLEGFGKGSFRYSYSVIPTEMVCRISTSFKSLEVIHRWPTWIEMENLVAKMWLSIPTLAFQTEHGLTNL